MISALVMTNALADRSSGLGVRLGPERREALRARLVGEAQRWARSLAPQRVVCTDALVELPALLKAGPVVVVRPELPLFRPDAAGAVIGDLEAGCELVLGPLASGGFYLVAVAGPGLDLSEELLGDGDLTRLASISRPDTEIGMLRVERPLRTAADVDAALADPLLPEGLRGLLDG